MGVISLDLQQTDAGANKWSYNWLTDLPSINGVTIQGDLTLEDLDIIIPTLVSQLENDVGYITEEELGDRFYTKDEVYNKEETYNKGEVDSIFEDYYTSDEVDTKISDEATARAGADSALSNRIDTNATNINSLAGDIAANSRAISDEATARQNADSALSGRIDTNASNIATNTANIATNTANIATNTSAIAQNTSDIATNAANIATNTANIATNAAGIATNASDIAGETDAREIADQGLQEQIDALAASSDVVDIVGTYAALQAYDTSKLHDNDIIKVLDDETRNDATTYYRWSVSTSTWSYIGAEGPFYTKADADATFVPQTRTINSKALSSNITLTAQDVGALPDSTVIPTVNDATLTIQKNGTTVQTFTANSSSNKTANITVPTKTSDLTNDGDGNSNFATETYVDTYGGKIDVIKVNGAAQTITNKTVDLTVPTKTSDLTNDSNFAVDANYVHTDNNFTTTLKNKLNGIASGAEVNQNAFSNVKVGSTTVSADSKTDTLELVAGSNVTITPNATNDKVTIAATDTKYNDMTGATSSAAGSHGLVPAPAAGDNTKFLSGDGTWKTVSQYELPIASANTLGGVKIGENLSITNTGVLSADAQHIDVDSAMSTTSENPVQNKVITEALAGKTNTKRSYTTATTLNYKKITVVGGTYSTDGSGIILFTREERYIIDGMCASGYGGKCLELGTNHNANNTSATTSNRWVNIKVYGVPESRTTEIYCRMSPYTYVDVHSSGTITITDINEATWNAAKNNATYIPLLGTDTALSTTSVAPVQNKAVTTALNSKADTSSLATVATSGAYADLTGLPTIPVVNNATLTIQKNGTTVKTFTANASSNVTANITVPTATSELTNDAGFIDEIPVASAGTLGGVKVGSNLSINASGVLSADDCPVYTAQDVSPATDSTADWKTVLGGEGVYYTWYRTSGKFAKQPSQYGFMRTIIGTNDVRQDFWVQTDGAHYYRTGNGIGWYGKSGNAGSFRYLGNDVDTALSTTSNNPVRNSVVTTKINEIDRFYRGLVPLGTEITANKNLNTVEFLKVGKYYCSTNATVATLTNCPTGTAFMMEVFSPLSTTIDNETTSTWVYRMRVITELDGDMWYQGCNSDGTANNWTYGAWNKVARIADIDAKPNSYWGTCSTAAATAAKVVTVASSQNFKLVPGAMVTFALSNTNTANNPTINVNGTGAKQVKYNAGVITTGNLNKVGYSNRPTTFVYDGTYWVWVNWSVDDNTTYSTMSVAEGQAGTATTARTVRADYLKQIIQSYAVDYVAGDHIDINSNNVISAKDYVHSENPTAATSASTISGNDISNGSITFAKTATGEFLKLQLSTVDIGEGASLPANTLYGVYE